MVQIRRACVTALPDWKKGTLHNPGSISRGQGHTAQGTSCTVPGQDPELSVGSLVNNFAMGSELSIDSQAGRAPMPADSSSLPTGIPASSVRPTEASEVSATSLSSGEGLSSWPWPTDPTGLPSTGPSNPTPPDLSPTPPVPDGAQVFQPLLLQDFLGHQQVIQLLFHSWRSLDALTGHELTGQPDTASCREERRQEERRGGRWGRGGGWVHEREGDSG